MHTGTASSEIRLTGTHQGGAELPGGRRHVPSQPRVGGRPLVTVLGSIVS
jgi:hypothetical protein